MLRPGWMVLLGLGLATPAWGSTLPRADLMEGGYLGLGLGTGVSVSLAIPLASRLALEGSLASGLWGGQDAQSYDLHLSYGLVQGGRKELSVAGLLGLWGASRFTGFGALAPGLEVGFALEYPFTPQLTARLSLLVPYYGLTSSWLHDLFGGPAGGAEVGWRVVPWWELTLGYNGQGAIVGSKLSY